MPAPIGQAESFQICFRTDPRQIERADALIDFVTSVEGKPATRASVCRAALVRGLAAIEAEAAAGGVAVGPKPKPRKRPAAK